MALPILIGDDFYGVMEFLSKVATEADPELFKTFDAIMLQISQALLRDQVRRRA